MRSACALLAALAVSLPASAQITIPESVTLKQGRLGKIEAISKTSVKWLNLHEGLDLVADSTGKFALIVGHVPGTYKIAAFTGGPDGPSDPAYCLVTITASGATPGGGVSPPAKVDPKLATCKLRFASAGCTATIIGPMGSDGFWSALTAAHCTGAVGSKGTITLPDGRTFTVTVTARDTEADLSWLRIESKGLENIAYAILAKEIPPVGTKIWHCGYGVDQPGNREEGNVTGGQDSNGQIRMTLSVSSGDSGSGIFRADTGELVAVVCCTSARGTRATMWGGSCVSAERLRKASLRERPLLILPFLETEVQRR